jgi:hypothetical protein
VGFLLPKEVKMKTERMEITPELASIFLESNTSNRSLSRDVVKAYANDMKAGNWSTTHQGIAFYEDGTLADGQHRLHAIVISGATVSMLVTTGIPREECLNIDNHRVRKTHDAFKIAGSEEWMVKQDIVAIARLSFSAFYKKDKASNSEIFELMQANKPHFIFINSITAAHRKGISAPLLTALVSAHKCGVSESVLSEFVSIIYSGVTTEKHHITAIKLRDILRDVKQTGTTVRKELLLKSQRAIHAFSQKQILSRIYLPENYIYSI